MLRGRDENVNPVPAGCLRSRADSSERLPAGRSYHGHAGLELTVGGPKSLVRSPDGASADPPVPMRRTSASSLVARTTELRGFVTGALQRHPGNARGPVGDEDSLLRSGLVR